MHDCGMIGALKINGAIFILIRVNGFKPFIKGEIREVFL